MTTSSPPQPPPSPRPWWRRWYTITAAVVLVLGIVGALSGTDDDRSEVAATTTTAVATRRTTAPEPTSTTAAPTSSATTATSTSTTSTTTTTTTTTSTTTTTAPPPQPVVFEGTGDDVLAVSIAWPAFARGTHQGSRNFIAQTTDADGELVDLIFNTIGTYSGEVVLEGWRDAVFIEITADGPWRIELVPLEAAAPLDPLAGAEGRGDVVRTLILEQASRVRFTHDGESNFVVLTHDRDGGFGDLVINEIGPYDATVLLRPAPFLSITADGAWTVSAA